MHSFSRILGALLAVSGLSLAGCGGDPAPSDAGAADAGPVDAGAGSDVTELSLPGLDGPVEVTIDDRGVPHIAGTTRHDVLMAEGFLMSRDRFGQMEFIRRSVLGTVAEVAGEDLIPSDLESRFQGYARVGREVYESLPPTDTTRLTAEAFVEGINAYIDRVRDGRMEDPAVRGAETVNLIVSSTFFGHWSPADVFAMARFQAANLSYDGTSDARRSQRLAAILAAFPADSSDPRIAARAGFFSDMFGEWPARDAFTRDGFNDGSTSALRPPGLDGARPSPARWVASRASLEGALPFLERLSARGEQVFGDLVTRGSNNWTVGGALTASGHPILANDPHLSLISPPVWWYVHLDTARMGGEDGLEGGGVAFAGLPGVVLGYNRNLAWGATTTGYDVTDVYEEQLTGACDASGNVTSGTVRFQGAEVPVAFYEEVVHARDEVAPLTAQLPYVPHHGMLVPGSCAPVAGMAGRFTALSIRYTGDEPSNELAYFTGLLTATNVEEARAAQDAFRVGSQNFMVIDRDDISWSTESRVPVRDARAMTYAVDPATGVPSGLCPHLVLPGTGEAEWTADLDARFVPHDTNPTRGWMATSNQDNVGVTTDGNPCNDPHYLGGSFDYGWRQARIQERLGELAARGGVTTDDMIRLQAETQSPLGRSMRDALVTILQDPMAADPSLSSADAARLADVRARWMAWTFETPHGVGSTDAAEIADSVATTIFNAALTRIIPLALGDEMAAFDGGTPSSEAARLLEWMLVSPGRLFSYDETLGQSVLWDDLRTPAVETREQIVVRGVLAGLDFLTTRLGSDLTAWRWGRLHTVRFESVVPTLGTDILSIPAVDDAMYPEGFPRHGDSGNVDPGNFGLWNTERFSFGSGASQRLVVEMTPEGPRAFNAIPGGQSIDPDSPHKADEAMLWIRNEQPAMHFEQADIEAHAERRLRFRP